MNPTPPRHRPAGFSLLEVLVAVLVLAVGWLAMAQLAAQALMQAKRAQFQSVAAELAVDYGERMRANAGAAAAGAYDQEDVAGAGPLAAASCVDADCTSASLAAQDKAAWLLALRQRLPKASALVRRAGSSPVVVDVWLRWAEPTLNEADTGAGSACADTPLRAKGSASGPLWRCLHWQVAL